MQFGSVSSYVDFSAPILLVLAKPLLSRLPILPWPMRVAPIDKPADSVPLPKNWEADPLARESENVLMPVEPPHAAPFAPPCSHSRFSSPTRAWGRRLVAPQGTNLRYAPRRLATTPSCRALA